MTSYVLPSLGYGENPAHEDAQTATACQHPEGDEMRNVLGNRRFHRLENESASVGRPLHMIVDRSSFDEDDIADSYDASGKKAKKGFLNSIRRSRGSNSAADAGDDDSLSDDASSVHSLRGSDDDAGGSSGRVRRKMKAWRPRPLRRKRRPRPSLSSNRSLADSSLGGDSIVTTRSGKSFHTFNSTETQKKSNVSSQRPNNHTAQPEVELTHGGGEAGLILLGTIDNEGRMMQQQQQQPPKKSPHKRQGGLKAKDGLTSDLKISFDPYNDVGIDSTSSLLSVTERAVTFDVAGSDMVRGEGRFVSPGGESLIVKAPLHHKYGRVWPEQSLSATSRQPAEPQHAPTKNVTGPPSVGNAKVTRRPVLPRKQNDTQSYNGRNDGIVTPSPPSQFQSVSVLTDGVGQASVSTSSTASSSSGYTPVPSSPLRDGSESPVLFVPRSGVAPTGFTADEERETMIQMPSSEDYDNTEKMKSVGIFFGVGSRVVSPDNPAADRLVGHVSLPPCDAFSPSQTMPPSPPPPPLPQGATPKRVETRPISIQNNKHNVGRTSTKGKPPLVPSTPVAVSEVHGQPTPLPQATHVSYSSSPQMNGAAGGSPGQSKGSKMSTLVFGSTLMFDRDEYLRARSPRSREYNRPIDTISESCSAKGDTKENGEASTGRSSGESLTAIRPTADEYDFGSEDSLRHPSPLPPETNMVRDGAKEVSKSDSLCTSQRGVALRKSRTGPVDVDEGRFIDAERYLRAIHDVASQHLQHGETDEALEVFEEILRGQKERHGDDSYRVGTALHNIGVVYLRSRDYAQAVEVCTEAVEVRRRALGPDHLDVAVSLAQLGIAHLELDEHKAALVAFREALRIRRTFLGPKHPRVAKLLNNIGCVLFEVGELNGARLAFEEALGIHRNMMRDSPSIGSSCNPHRVDHILLSIASTLCNIGSIKLRWRQYDEAIVSLEEALLIQQSVLGDDHRTVLNTIESIDLVDRSRLSNERVHNDGPFFHADSSSDTDEQFGGCVGGLTKAMTLNFMQSVKLRQQSVYQKMQEVVGASHTKE